MATKDISDATVCDAYAEAERLRVAGWAWPEEILAQRTGEPAKFIWRAMERACAHGLIDYGVSLRGGWLTEKGRAVVTDASATTRLPEQP